MGSQFAKALEIKENLPGHTSEGRRSDTTAMNPMQMLRRVAMVSRETAERIRRDRESLWIETRLF